MGLTPLSAEPTDALAETPLQVTWTSPEVPESVCVHTAMYSRGCCLYHWPYHWVT